MGGKGWYIWILNFSNNWSISDKFNSVGAGLTNLQEKFRKGVDLDQTTLQELKQTLNGWKEVRNCDLEGPIHN
jgi:hypothetical protein